MKKDDFRDYLEDIVKNMELAVEFCSTVDFDEFDKDIMRSYAVVRCLPELPKIRKLFEHIENAVL